MIANNISLLSKEVAPHFTADDIAKIKKFSKQKGVVSIRIPGLGSIIKMVYPFIGFPL